MKTKVIERVLTSHPSEKETGRSLRPLVPPNRLSLPAFAGVLFLSLATASECTAQVELSLALTDGLGNPINEVDAYINDPAIAGADFVVVINTSDATDLATYSQRVAYDSNLIRYVIGIHQGGLPDGFGKNPGSVVISVWNSDSGTGSYIDCTSSGISGYSGPQSLLLMAFEVTGVSGVGVVTIQDNPESTAPYANGQTVNIPHTSPGVGASFTIVGDPLPTNTPSNNWNDTPTERPTDTPLEAVTATATPPDSEALVDIWIEVENLCCDVGANPVPNCEVGGGRADILLNLWVSEVTNLGMYSQRVDYDSSRVRYLSGSCSSTLGSGDGQSSGMLVVDETAADRGSESYIIVSGSGISDQASVMKTIARFGFEITGSPGQLAELSIRDNPDSSAPYATEQGENIPHQITRGHWACEIGEPHVPAQIGVEIRDTQGAPLSLLDSGVDDPSLWGADFLLVITTTEAQYLSWFSQRIRFDSNLIRYIHGMSFSGLAGGSGSPGSVFVSEGDTDNGTDSWINCYGDWIGDYSGPQDLALLAFDVVGPAGASGEVYLQDRYYMGDCNIPHSTSGLAAPFTILDEPLPTSTPAEPRPTGTLTTPTATRTPMFTPLGTPTNTPEDGIVRISVNLYDPVTLHEISLIDPHRNDPATGGADFLAAIQVTDARNLNKYDQSLLYDSNVIRYVVGADISGLPSGFGKDPGSMFVDSMASDIGEDSLIRVAGYGIKGYFGSEALALLGFEATADEGGGRLRIEDAQPHRPWSATYPFLDWLGQNIPHTSPGNGASFAILGEPLATNTPGDTPTNTPTHTRTSTPTETPVPPTNTVPPGVAVISVTLHDSSLNPISEVNADVNDPAIRGADFLVALNTSEATDLATYSQRIGYDSNLVRYKTGVYQTGLQSGLGKDPGMMAVSEFAADEGVGSYIDVSGYGIRGQDGPGYLSYLGFEVLGLPGLSGTVTVKDNPESTAPYTDSGLRDIPHTSPGIGASFILVGDTPTQTMTPSITLTQTITLTPSITNTPSITLVDTPTRTPLDVWTSTPSALTLWIGSVSAECGIPVPVPVDIFGARNLDAFGASIVYEPESLDYLGMTPGEACGDWADVEGRENSPGVITLGGFRGAGTFVNGSGTLAYLSFMCRVCPARVIVTAESLVDDIAEAELHPGTIECAAPVSTDTPTDTPVSPTATGTFPPGVAVISVTLHDSSLNPITQVNADVNDPAIGGADFLAALNTSDATDLATYSQRISYDSRLVRYRDGVFQNPLQGGFGKNPGSAVIDGLDADIGPRSLIDCTLSGMSGYTGPEILMLIGFEVTGPPAVSGMLTVEDNPNSTAPYADQTTVNIPHTSPGTAASFTIVDEPLPTDTPGGPTETPVRPTDTRIPGDAVISVTLHDASLVPVTHVDPDVNDPAIGGADFLVALNTSESTDLATYSQRISYDSHLVRYRDGVFQNPLQGGFGKNPGSAVIDGLDADIGPRSRIDCTLSGMSGYAGPQILLLFGFEVTGPSGVSGALMVEDNPASTAPYADNQTVNIPHTSPGVGASFTIAGQRPPTDTPSDTPTNTPTDTPGIAVISVTLHGSSLNPITQVNADVNDPAIGGADFLVALNTSDATDLAAYSQRISYDSGLVRYMDSIFQNPLQTGFGKNPGSVMIDGHNGDIGPRSRIDCTLSGMSGYTGPQILLLFGFEVTGRPAVSGAVMVEDNPVPSAPYADNLWQNIPHTSPGLGASFTIVDEPPATNTPGMPTDTPVQPKPTVTPTGPTATSPPTFTPLGTPTETPEPGIVRISVHLYDPTTLNEILYVDPDRDDPATGGSDFLAAVEVTDTNTLATYAQSLFYDSNLVRYVVGVYNSGLESGFGKNPGYVLVDSVDSDIGENSFIKVAANGISGYSGPQALALLGFEATTAHQAGGRIRIEDAQGSTAPFADWLVRDIPHTSPGNGASFAILGEPRPTDTPLPPTWTPTFAGPIVQVDLDRDTPGIQRTLNAEPGDLIRGSVVLFEFGPFERFCVGLEIDPCADLVPPLGENEAVIGNGCHPDPVLNLSNLEACRINGGIVFSYEEADASEKCVLYTFDVGISDTALGGYDGLIHLRFNQSAQFGISYGAETTLVSQLEHPSSEIRIGPEPPTRTPTAPLPTRTPTQTRTPSNTPTPTQTPTPIITATSTPLPFAVTGLGITGGLGNELREVDPAANDPALGGADFALEFRVGETNGLAFYHQRIFYDSNLVRFNPAFVQNPLPEGGPGVPGELEVDAAQADQGPGSNITIHGAGLAGWSGERCLARLGFDVIRRYGTGTIHVYDDTRVPVAFGGSDGLELPHTEIGNPVEFQIRGLLVLNVLPGTPDSAFYPNLLARVQLTHQGGSAVDTTPLHFSVWEKWNGEVRLWQRLSVRPARERPAEIIFCVDSSGSMRDEIDAVRENIQEFVNILAQAHIPARLGLVSFGDEPITYDSSDLADTELTEDVQEFISWVPTSTSGGDEHSLESVTTALSYRLRPEAQRIVILITDEPPEMYFRRDEGIARNLVEAQEALAREKAVLFWWGTRRPFDRLGGIYLGDTNFAGALTEDLTRFVIDHVEISGDSQFPADGSKRKVQIWAEREGEGGVASFEYTAPQFVFPTPVPGDPDCASGDVDQDGYFDMADVQLVLDLAVGVAGGAEYSECRADRDGDGRITPSDAERLYRIAPKYPGD